MKVGPQGPLTVVNIINRQFINGIVDNSVIVFTKMTENIISEV